MHSDIYFGFPRVHVCVCVCVCVCVRMHILLILHSVFYIAQEKGGLIISTVLMIVVIVVIVSVFQNVASILNTEFCFTIQQNFPFFQAGYIFCDSTCVLLDLYIFVKLRLVYFVITIYILFAPYDNAFWLTFCGFFFNKIPQEKKARVCFLNFYSYTTILIMYINVGYVKE